MRVGGAGSSVQAGTCLALLVEDEEALKRIEKVERGESERLTEIMTGTSTGTGTGTVVPSYRVNANDPRTRQGFAGRERDSD